MAMTSEKKFKKEKEIVLEFDIQSKDIRQQLNEQLKCLDTKLENQLAMVAEIQEFFKRRAELEIEYSRQLDRLVKSVMVRHKQEKARRETWHLYSTYTCWQNLLAITKKQSKDHALVSEIYNNQMTQRLSDVMEDSQRLFKSCREVGVESHEEILKVLNELQSAMKTYHVYHTESKQAEAKLKTAETQKSKIEQHLAKSGEKGSGAPSRKFKTVEKQAEKRQAKYQENKLKALKARNEYILTIDSANAALNKYFVDDLSDLIDCMDFGYHNSMARSMMMCLSVEESMKVSRKFAVDVLNKCISDLSDARLDKQKFLESNSTIFALPKKFDFQPHKGDEVCQISAQKTVQDDLVQRHQQLSGRLTSLKLENDETWKSIEAADKSLMDMINIKDYDVGKTFQDPQKAQLPSPSELSKRKANRQETEQYYLMKFREYILSSNKISRLQAKHTSIQKALGEGEWSTKTGTRPPSLPPKPKKQRRIGRLPLVGQPKLFGGSIEEYTEASEQEIPLIITSCIKVINLYGMHHQGVFRVSGSQLEINEFKAAFEKGEDPLETQADGNSINSIAGVLKMYFRELREPIFPPQMFDALIDCSTLETTRECVDRLKELIGQLPRPVFVVLRYLFAFLNHVSEFSDENMMDPYNLAICFGPTLLPIPSDKDQVAFQGNVNDLVKNMITHQEEIFTNDGGPVYERLIMDEGDGAGEGSDEEEGGYAASEDDHYIVEAFLNKLWTITEPEVLEAIAQFDYSGRSGRELSFKKGDTVLLFNQVSSDWWEGCYQGKEGLVPDKYIQLKPRDTDSKSVSSEEDKRRSTESLPTKTLLSTLKGELSPNLDKSVSQPNIATLDSPDSLPPTIPAIARQKSLEDNPTTSSQSSDTMAISETEEDITQDIDNALAEMMSNLHSLELQQKTDRPLRTASERKPTEEKPLIRKHSLPSANPKHTPDLVLDLPPNTESPSPPQEKNDPDSPSDRLSAAETFAMSNQCTMKKGSSSSMPRSITYSNSFKGDKDDPRVVKRSASTSATISAREGRPVPVYQADTPPPVVQGRQSPAAGGTSSPVPPPKPAVKVKPPVMKKPTRSPDPMNKPKGSGGATAL